MKQKLFFFMMALLSTITASAYDVEIKGLYYNINDGTMTATVTYKSYSGSNYNANWNINTANIPASVEYYDATYSVTSIDNRAFQGCKGLTSVTIPNSVTSIGKEAFYGCSGLTSVTIGNSVTSIGQLAFYNCSGLTSITIPNSVTSIGNSAFRGCSGLTSVTIGNSVTSIGKEAFYGCSGLTSVTIPNSVTSIGNSAFIDTSITEIHITDITSWCTTKFSDFTFPSNNKLYLNGEDIKELEIPESVTEIGTCSFKYCSDITSVKVHWNRPLAGGADSFLGTVKKNATLYVPKGTAMMYMAAPGWTEFVNIMEYEDGEDAHYITIRMGDGGVLKQSVEVGQTYTYAVIADDGWEVNTLTFDGKDMTSLLLDGQFSTPVITGNSEVNVVFKQIGTRISEVQEKSNVKVYAHARTITITGAEENTPVAIYNMGGVMVKSSVGNTTIPLDSGAYIIKVGKESFKVAL